jgi:hypothetical protein
MCPTKDGRPVGTVKFSLVGTVRCGCGILCANQVSYADHARFCNKALSYRDVTDAHAE